MTAPDPFETIQVPDDADYWDALAGRVATSAARASNRTTLSWLAGSRAPWAAVSVLLAAVLVLVMRMSSSTGLAAELTQAMAPSDTVGQAILLSDGPPAIGALLLGGQVERVR